MTTHEEEEETTICDCCAQETPVAETQPGIEGTEWAGATLCNDCNAENGPTK